MKKSSINIIGLALSVTFFLTSCAGGGTDEPVQGPEPTATLHETPGLEETPEPEEPVVEEPVEPEEPEEPEVTADDFTAGEVLDEKPESLPKGVTAYEMPDGTFVAVKRDEPMPKEAASAVRGSLETVLPVPAGTLSTGAGTLSRIASEEASSLRHRTGKEIVIVFPIVNTCDASADARLNWTHTRVHYTDTQTCENSTFTTRDAAITAAEAQIAKQEEPSAYEVIVRENN